MEDRSQKSRSEFASLVAARTKGRNPAIERAFASVRREAFAGPGPWSIAKLDAAGYVRTPNDDPAHLYQDVVIALDPVRNLNIDVFARNLTNEDAFTTRYLRSDNPFFGTRLRPRMLGLQLSYDF